MSRLTKLKSVFTGFLLAGLVATGWVQAKGPLPDGVQITIPANKLTEQGSQTYALIYRGGPFPYEKDGTIFGNRERLLPSEKRGYYREYTVSTPGLKHRGARRIVCGGKPTAPETCYYTADHYASFRKIEP